MTNEALREHVTSVGFSLTLSKRMIDLLCALHYFKGNFEELIAWEYQGERPQQRERMRAFSHIVPSSHALGARGLIDPEPKNWNLTKAGHLTVALLKEAGIYHDRITELGIITKEAA